MAQWHISLNVLNCGGLAPHRTSDPRVVGSIPTNVVLARSEKVMLVPVVVRYTRLSRLFSLEYG